MPDRKPRKHPHMITFVLIVVMHDQEAYRVAVDAQTREDACREIIHTQMAKGLVVRSIRDSK